MPRSLSVVVACMMLMLVGCGPRHLPVAPVKGKVLYRGKPLPSGSVMLQPMAGPPPRGIIQPDGTFELSTFGDRDGAILGTHQVRIVCESNRPGQATGTQPRPADAIDESAAKNRSLIPTKYAYFDSSGLQAEVTANNAPIEWNLKD